MKYDDISSQNGFSSNENQKSNENPKWGDNIPIDGKPMKEKVKEVLEKAPTFDKILSMFLVVETQEMANLRAEIVELFRKLAGKDEYMDKYKELEELLRKNFTGINGNEAIMFYMAYMNYEGGRFEYYIEDMEEDCVGVIDSARGNMIEPIKKWHELMKKNEYENRILKKYILEKYGNNPELLKIIEELANSLGKLSVEQLNIVREVWLAKAEGRDGDLQLLLEEARTKFGLIINFQNINF